MTYTLHTGDCRDVMATMEAESVDAIVCDPPYGLSFMGKGWDHGVPGVDFWTEALRVLKPGGHLIAFGGTRTYHRLAVAIEDAGFEVRDCLMWLYGSGFPKSLDVSKAMDKQAGAEREVVGTWKPTGTAAVKIKGGGHANAGVRGEVEEIRQSIAITAPNTDLAKQWHGWGTALKPAYEPAILARKPLTGTVADNVAQWGTGALNIDGCRVGSDGGTTRSEQAPYGEGGRGDQGGTQNWRTGHKILETNTGRWPANVILDEDAAAALDEQSGERAGGRRGIGKGDNGNVFGSYFNSKTTEPMYNDTGGASRFFYTAKASRSEREAGLDGVEAKAISNAKHGGNMMGSEWVHDSRHPEGGYKTAITAPRANHHPTVKPIALMRYMVRLVTPPGGVVLDPFMGSGSTGCGAVLEGMRFVGIDITPEYVEIARRRIAHHAAQGTLPI